MAILFFLQLRSMNNRFKSTSLDLLICNTDGQLYFSIWRTSKDLKVSFKFLFSPEAFKRSKIALYILCYEITFIEPISINITKKRF